MSTLKALLKVVALFAVLVPAGVGGFWVQHRVWQFLGVDMPWWGYVLFWGPIAVIALVVGARQVP